MSFAAFLGAVFRGKGPVLQAVGRQKAGSDRELDREFTGTSTVNTPGINREIDREMQLKAGFLGFFEGFPVVFILVHRSRYPP
jgi:hypothetical protein